MYTFTTLLLLLSPVPDSTIYPIPYCIKETTPFKWTNYEVEVSQRFKDSALKKFRDTYSSSAGKLPDNFPESFHFLNLNGDKLVDVIYAGNAGSEGPYVNFYLNTGSIFKPCVPTQLGYVWDLKYQQNKLTAFVIYNPGCCAEVVEFERHYSVTPSFQCKLEWQGAILEEMSKTKPDSFFVEPISFQTLNENYSLRYEPITTDEVPPVLHEAVDNEKSLRGNVTAVYPKGAIGKAWARKKDSTGREWWLVEMEPLKYLSFDAYYSLDDFPTHYIGWMSSRFVKRID